MKSLCRFISVTITLFSMLLLQACTSSTPPLPDRLLLQNVNIVDPVDGQIIPEQQVFMENGLITQIQPMQAVLSGVPEQVVDGENGYVTPGLIDMHVHVYEQSALSLALSHGVVHQRVMNGMPQILKWRDEVKKGEYWGSSLTVSSPIVTGNPDAVLRTYAGTPEQGAQVVYDAWEAGYDLIKLYNTLDAETFAAVVYQASELGIPVALHGPHPPEGLSWQELGSLQTLEHVEDIFQGPLQHQQDQQILDDTIALYQELDVTISATLAIFEQLTRISHEKQAFVDALPGDYISPIIAWYEKGDQVQRWIDSDQGRGDYNLKELDYLLEITRQLHEKKVKLVLGSDSGVLLMPFGHGTHNELELFSRAGLSNIDALRTGTINAAKALKKSTELGQIKPGFRADFIYTKQNPITDLTVLRYPDAMVTSGHWHDAEKLQQLRKQAIAERSFWQEFWLIISNY